MLKNNSNNIYVNKGKYYIRFYDPTESKYKSKSTGLLAIKENLGSAIEIRDKFFEEIKKIKKVLNETKNSSGSISEAKKQFLKINNNKSDSSKWSYNQMFRHLETIINFQSNCNALNKIKSEEFVLYLRNLELQQNTKFNLFKSFKKFLNFLFEYDYIYRHFKINKDVAIKQEVKPPVIFSDNDIELIISNLNPTANVYKDKFGYFRSPNSNFITAIFVLYYTGLRPSDFLYWKVSDIDLNNRTVAYHSPKVNTYNNIPLHPKLIPILRTRISEVNSGRIFEYTNEKNLGHAFKRFLKALNIDRPEYTLRTFRKHFISLMQKQKMPITMVAKLVGHKKIETTNKYYTYFSTEDMSNELEKIKF